jgi:cell division transport system permease protein
MNRNAITLRRVIKNGAENFIRNASLSIAATAVMVVTLTIVLFSIIANATFAHTIAQINDKIDISVYLKDSVNDQQRDSLIGKLKGLSSVKSIDYISKQQALDNYRRDNQDNLELQLAISQTDNPLPATLRIKPVNPSNISDIKGILDSPDVQALQSDKTSYSGDRKEAIDKISAATAFFRKAVFISVIVFAIISMLIIFNTIQMAIFNRRDELTIMRLLGANNWYIRGPFIVETMFYGIVSAIISVSLCNFLFVVQANAFNATSLGLLDIKYSNDYFASHFWLFLLLQLLAGMAIGAVSALSATKRYLRAPHTSLNKRKLRFRR